MNSKAKRITTIAMLCAISYAVMAVGRVPVVLFLKYDPKDVIITLAFKSISDGRPLFPFLTSNVSISHGDITSTPSQKFSDQSGKPNAVPSSTSPMEKP